MRDVRALETGTAELLARVIDRVCVLALNRPEARNALGAAPAESAVRTHLDRVGAVTGTAPARHAGS